MNRVKAVIFDFGGTLAEGDMQWDDYKITTVNLLARYGHQIDTSQLYEARARKRYNIDSRYAEN